MGYKAVGKIHAEDYQKLEPQIKALVDQYDDDVCLLINLQEFTGEEVRAWLPDLRFGHRFHDKINKMAIVGDQHWQQWLAALAAPFYAKQAKLFHPDESDQAWAWLRTQETDEG